MNVNCNHCGKVLTLIQPFDDPDYAYYACEILSCKEYNVGKSFNKFKLTPKSIYQKAEELINGDRRKSYGPVEDSFKASAAMASSILFNKLKEPITSHEWALIMAGYKLVREAFKEQEDNRIDACGYIGLADQLVRSKEGN